jgi:prolyl-tRNA synthetase
MRYSQLFGGTLREKPRNADSTSHQLLLRAGFLRPAAGGGFLLLPLGQRTLERLRAIAAQEIAGCGIETVGFPAARNSDLARSLRLRRREAGLDFPYADQHESALAALAGNPPAAAAGIRWAERDGARPNWGLLAGPEFLFHSAYVFSASEADARAALARLSGAYHRVLEHARVPAFRLGDEFAIETPLAARPILTCRACGYAAGAETAVSRVPEWPQEGDLRPAEDVYGPGLIQTAPLAEVLGIPVHQTTKALLFEAAGRVVAACVAGVYDVSEGKLARVLNCRALALAAPETVRELTRSEVGYAGPVGLPDSVEVIWDLSMERRCNFEAGANRTGYHSINLNFGRDLPRPAVFHDIRAARDGERCAQCDGGTLEARRAIALGHATFLGDAYSALLGAKGLVAGCAGLDLTAALAAVVESNSDDRGIRWPAAIAPFAAQLVSLPPAAPAAETLYDRLSDAGVPVLWDDRSESAGVKFGDADLIGLPVRLVLSKRTGDRVELKARAEPQGELIPADEVVKRVSGNA